MDTILLTKITSILLPPDKDKVFIIIDEKQTQYHFKSKDNQKWANLMKEQCNNIPITSSSSSSSASSLQPKTPTDDANEIKENSVIDDIENDLSIVPFDIGL